MFALVPAAPGVRLPSSEILSPGTGAVERKPDCSVITSSREAQAEIRNPVAENKTAKIAKCLITRETLTRFLLSLA